METKNRSWPKYRIVNRGGVEVWWPMASKLRAVSGHQRNKVINQIIRLLVRPYENNVVVI